MAIPPKSLECVHIRAPGGGLCPACREAFDADPDAYIEFGDHPAGLERWWKLQEDMDREAAHDALDPDPYGLPLPPSDEIPF